MARKGGNPGTYFAGSFQGEISKKAVAVKLPLDLHEYVRSLPNRAEWLRTAIAKAMEEDLKNAG